MKAKTSSKVSVIAVVISVLSPIGNKALDTTQKVVESKLVKAEATAKDESDFKDAVIMDAVNRISALEVEVKQLKGNKP